MRVCTRVRWQKLSMCICHRRDDEMRMSTSGRAGREQTVDVGNQAVPLAPPSLIRIRSVTHR